MKDEHINRLTNQYIFKGIFAKLDVIKTFTKLKLKTDDAIETLTETLTKLKKQTDSVISVIVLACDNEYDGIKISAIEAIDELKIKTPEIMFALTKLCEDENEHIRKYACEVKKKLGETLEDHLYSYVVNNVH